MLVLLLTFYVFWRASFIHRWYYTWTYSLFTPQFDRTEFGKQITQNNLLSKCFIFVMGNLVIFMSLNIDAVVSEFEQLSDKFLSLLHLHATLVSVYLFGALLHWLKRVWFKWSLGDNYERLVGTRSS